MASSRSSFEVLIALTLISSCSACLHTPKSIAVFEGTKAKLKCKVVRGFEGSPDPSFRSVMWNLVSEKGETFHIDGKSGRVIELPGIAGNYSTEPHGKLSVSHRLVTDESFFEVYKFYIWNVTKEDGKIGFSCSLWEGPYMLIHTSESINLTVSSLPKPNCSYEVINMSNGNLSTGVGIQLLCAVPQSDSPPVPLSWYANGSQISQEETDMNALFYWFKPSDIGKKFTCRANIDTVLAAPSCSVTPAFSVSRANSTLLVLEEVATGSPAESTPTIIGIVVFVTSASLLTAGLAYASKR